MEQKQRFFIYDRKEMGVLLLLGTLVALFAFTLGVHLGKRVGPKAAALPGQEPISASTLGDKFPNRQELVEQGRGANQAAEESLNQALHEEVVRTGIKLDDHKQVNLPEKTRAEKVGVAKPEAVEPLPIQRTVEPISEHGATVDHTPADSAPAPELAAKFTLQIGSHPSLSDAKVQLDDLEAKGLKPFQREAVVKGRKWYRVFVGGFSNKEAAEKAGHRYVSQHVIQAFVISKQ
jgi:cell division protein FtsN